MEYTDEERQLVKDPLQLAEEASKAFNAQAEEASKAMGADIPDLEGAEL